MNLISVFHSELDKSVGGGNRKLQAAVQSLRLSGAEVQLLKPCGIRSPSRTHSLPHRAHRSLAECPHLSQTSLDSTTKSAQQHVQAPLSPARWAWKPAAFKQLVWGGTQREILFPPQAPKRSCSSQGLCFCITELERLDMMEHSNSSCKANSTETGRLRASNTRPQKQD